MADFTISFINEANLEVQFTDISGGGPISWNWDLGDGTTSTLQNPSHPYKASGIYYVTLTTNIDSITHTIYIARPMTAPVIVAGTMYLDGELNVHGDVQVAQGGKVISVPDDDSKKDYWSYQLNRYITANGKGRSITSSFYNIFLNYGSSITGQGFESDRGPGNNSIGSDGTYYQGYGGTHFGLGYTSNPSAPAPKSSYGHYETPVSLGSGGGYYKDYCYTWTAYGGGAIKLKARNGYVSVNGNVLMDGELGRESGGGAGGSIWLIGRVVEGNGSLYARGGGSLRALPTGGGGGGYISIWHENTYSFNGAISVDGTQGSGDGKIFIKEIEPIIEDGFTGTISNVKWWDSSGHVSLNNELNMNLIPYSEDKSYHISNFKVGGDIIADVKVLADTTQINGYNAIFALYKDDNNWIGVARRYYGVYGMSCIDGILSYSGVASNYTDNLLRIVKTDSTFSLQYSDTSTNPVILYNEVFPQFERSKFSLRLGLERIDGTRVDVRRLTPLDIYNEYMSLDGPPVDNSDVGFNVVGGTSQYYGQDFYVNSGDYRLRWDDAGLWIPDATSRFNIYASVGDTVRAIYAWDASVGDGLTVAFDDVKVYEGIINDAESSEPVLYVDPDFGSDNSSGTQLFPLKNLFVATAWSKRGGTVVLYDGTHNPAAIKRKDLSIRGAEGIKPVITSINVQDTTGSGWETNALSFYGCQGRLDNVILRDSSIGLYLENSANYTTNRCEIFDTSCGIKCVQCDPDVLRTTFHDTEIGVDYIDCTSSYLYSNIFYNASIAIRASDTSAIIVNMNTIDDCTTAMLMYNSYLYVISNNITNSGTGIDSDSTFYSYTNNFYNTSVAYSGTPADATMNISADPMYILASSRDYRIGLSSADIGVADTNYDRYYYDYNGVSRQDRSDIGAYRYLVDCTHTGDYYVTAYGDDYTNCGGFYDPFRTLDKAMIINDATVHIDGGHYDTYYLSLKNVNIDLNDMFIYTRAINHLVSYHTLSAADVYHKYIELPGWLENPADNSNVGLNVIGGYSLYYGLDYTVSMGKLYWEGLGLEPYLEAGDVFRILYQGILQQKALNTLMFHQHYSNYETEKAIFVSPSGSDQTTLGGDGTNTGGNGSYVLPYRTVQRALEDSTVGSNIVLISGEYPVFDGLDGRIIVPAIDKTSVMDKEPKRYIQDFFSPLKFTALLDTEYYDSLWDFSYAGRSYASEDFGFLSMVYDGTNTVTAASKFELSGNFEAMTDLKNVVDPVTFMATGGDNTVFFRYYSGDYTTGMITNGRSFYCTGTLSEAPYDNNALIVEHIYLTGTDIRNRFVPLTYIPDPFDCSNFAMNIMGGAPQNYGEDYYVEDAKLKWDGMGIESNLSAGDGLRIIYR